MATSSVSDNEPALIQGRLDVPEFVKARQAEIRQLERAMEGLRSGTNKRAFQQVPRRLRRRTASHNAKRVPRRLRERAQYEIERDNAIQKPTSKRPPAKFVPDKSPVIQDIGPANVLASPPQPGRYAHRQKDKLWLPTHVWHKKRAHLEKRWGYMVPIKPSQKQYRATHRVVSNLGSGAAIAWDSSYYSTIVLRRDPASLSSADFQQVVAKVFPGAEQKLYTVMGRHWQGLVNNEAPALVCWTDIDSIMAQFHPMLFRGLWDHFTNINGISTFDYRHAIGTIDVVGPQALAALRAAIIPCTTSPVKARELWEILPGIGNVESLPQSSNLAFEMYDPRLNYPPHLHKPRGNVDKWNKAILDWPSNLQTHSLFNLKTRVGSINSMESQSSIDARRIAGHSVKFDPNKDPRIPVSCFFLSHGKVRILMPRLWVLPTWLSLTHIPNMLIGGLDQSRQMCFEKGLPHFPDDYTWTTLGQNYRTKHYQSKTTKTGTKKMEENDTVIKFCRQNKVTPVLLRCEKRGAPVENSRLYISEKGSERLIGFLTTGNFNLSEAMGTAIGVSTEIGECLVQNVGSEKKIPAQLTPVDSFPL